jgi:hypothetical protein
MKLTPGVLWMVYGYFLLGAVLMARLFVGILQHAPSPVPHAVLLVPWGLRLGMATLPGRVCHPAGNQAVLRLLRWAGGESATVMGGLAWLFDAPRWMSVPMILAGILAIVAQPPLGTGNA